MGMEDGDNFSDEVLIADATPIEADPRAWQEQLAELADVDDGDREGYRASG
jgi:hypothetical protein